MSRQRLGFATLVVLAAIGASLIVVIVATFWLSPGDDLAYWIAGHRLMSGEPIYATGDVAFEPYAYHYPPPLAQVLGPVTLLVPAVLYIVVFRECLLLATWELARRRMIPMLALFAFVPVAVAVRVENVDVFMALGIVLALRQWPWLFAVGALVKASPGLGMVYLALRGRWRDVFVAGAAGGVITIVSVVLAPDLWRAWLGAISGRADMVGNSLLPVPYLVRALAGLALTIVGGKVGRRRGELLLVAGITLANPGLALNGLAVLAAAVPIWLAGPAGIVDAMSPSSTGRAGTSVAAGQKGTA